MEGHTQGHLKRNKEDVLFRIPKTSYFRTRYKEISVIIAHSSEIETKKSLILKEKRLDLLGRRRRLDLTPIILTIRQESGHRPHPRYLLQQRNFSPKEMQLRT